MKKTCDDYSARCLASTVESNFFAALQSWGRSSRTEICCDPDMTRYVTGVPHPLFNGIFGARLAIEGIEKRIDEAVNFFRSRNLPMVWWTGPSTEPPDLADRLRLRGMSIPPGDGSLAGMAVDLDTMKTEGMSCGGLTIETVGDGDMLRSWVHAFAVCFGMQEGMEEPCFQLLADVGFSLPWRHYAGLMDGKIVGISSLFLGAGSAGIFNVATMPDVSGRGIGTALTLAPLVEAHQRGYRTGTLLSSHMGLGLYKRIGFRECCRFGLCMSSVKDKE